MNLAVDEKTGENTAIYVVDKNYEILYLSDLIKKSEPQAECGKKCYNAFWGRDCQCEKCPVGDSERGRDIYYDKINNQWVTIRSVPLELPAVGKCNMIFIEKLEEQVKKLFFDAVGNTDCCEFVELNYSSNCYQVVYQGKNNQNNKKNGASGIISDDIEKLAEKIIHPNDIEKFKDFWCIDNIGKPGVPERILRTRQSEVRKLQPDGTYKWVKQVMMPCRQNGPDEVLVMFFFHAEEIEEPEENEPNQLYTKQNFFDAASELIEKSSDDIHWALISIDLENFKMFNEWYGWKAGDDLLYSIKECLETKQNHGEGLGGYFGDDNFAFLMPACDEKIYALYHDIVQLAREYDEQMGFLPAMGICEITGWKESLNNLYDYAEMARTSVRNNYSERVKKFDSEMLKSLEYKYVLLSDIKKAMKNHEITFFLQPKCNMNDGRVIGAEALVRWISKEKGIISPAAFVPTLEKTGFISMLDTYIWEEVCKWQRNILDKGLPALTVAVNVSRSDLFFMDVPEHLLQLMKKYDLDPGLISVEITESIYAEDNDAVEDIVKRLRENGIKVSMDDFGSGYSSLNMLKDVEVDVLKIDMRFLDIAEGKEQKGFGILEAVNNMARLMGLNVIAEGVETLEQKDFLLQMGCDFGQGYYFYRPMPTAEYEHILEKQEKLDFEGFRPRNIQQLYLKDLLSDDLFSETMINNMLGAVAFFDVFGEDIIVRRYNEHLSKMMGQKNMQQDKVVNLKDNLSAEGKVKMMQMFKDAQKNRNEGAECDIRRNEPGGKEHWLRLHTFFLSEQDGHGIYYSSVSDVTDIYEKTETLRQQNSVLGFLNNDMPGGYYRYKNDDGHTFDHISKRFLNMVEFSEAEIQTKFDGKMLNMIHPDDRESVEQNINRQQSKGGNITQVYRLRTKSGYIKVHDLCRMVTYKEKKIFQGIILNDIAYYESPESSAGGFGKTIVPCGIFHSDADGDYAFGYVDDSLLNLLGYSRETFEDRFKTIGDLVYFEDHARIKEDMSNQIQKNNHFSCEFRVILPDGSLKWVYSRAILYTDDNGRRWFCTCIMDGEYFKEKNLEHEWRQTKYKLLLEIPGTIVFDYDPQADVLSAEIAGENGEVRNFVSPDFIKASGARFWLAEPTDYQKEVIRKLLQKPSTTVIEYQADFVGNGEFKWYRSYITSLADDEGIVYRIVGRSDNIESEMQTISKLQSQTMKDPVTRLLNGNTAKMLVADKANESEGGTLLVLDIDDFSKINDDYGHFSGDNLLRQAADKIKTVFRKGDILARLGGDEFMIFMPDVSDKAVAAYKAQEVLRKIHEIRLKDGGHLSCTIGISIEEGCGWSAEEMIQKAIVILHKGKEAGKDCYMISSK